MKNQTHSYARFFKAGAVACALFSFSLTGSSQAATLVASTDDAGINTNPGNGNGGAPTVYDVGNYAVRVGEYFAPGGSTYVIPFLLPTLAPGTGFDTADLRFQLFTITGTPANLDLYGLGARSLSTVLGSDYYNGSAVDPTDATLLKAGVVTSSMALGVYNTDAGTNSALVSYLNGQYAGGANAGKYVFLRFSYADAIPNSNTAYEILTMNAGGATEQPLLSYTVAAVPEPSTYALLGLGFAALVVLRRRAVAKA